MSKSGSCPRFFPTSLSSCFRAPFLSFRLRLPPAELTAAPHARGTASLPGVAGGPPALLGYHVPTAGLPLTSYSGEELSASPVSPGGRGGRGLGTGESGQVRFAPSRQDGGIVAAWSGGYLSGGSEYSGRTALACVPGGYALRTLTPWRAHFLSGPSTK